VTLAIVGETAGVDAWRRELSRRMADLTIVSWPELGAREDVEAVLTWMHPLGAFTELPNLRVIISQGAGVDHILRDPDLPQGVPIVRLVDPMLVAQMSEYVAAAVLRHHRGFPAYAAQQRARVWRELPVPDTGACTVGVLGLGQLGVPAARTLARLGFSVRGWSRTPKQLEGLETFAGDDALAEFLSGCQVLVCLLPLTPATENLLDARALSRLPRGAYLINAGRGEHVVEDDLLGALDRGQLSGACLDVFRTEPLPAEHPFWGRPEITITPHVASQTLARSASDQVVDALLRARAGRPLSHTVDRARGY
jgi:glyoxylate/hydroxypyruvate reductase